MNEIVKFIGAIVLFMLATMITYIWGLKRGEDPKKSLEVRLLHASGSKVEKYLKKNPYITTEGIEKLIRGSTVRDPMSRRMMRIDDPKLYAKGLIRFMLEQGVIEAAGKDGYCLKNKNAK